MMKYPKFSCLLVLFCAVVFISFSAPRAEARIGDGVETLERRLFASGGIMYRDAATQANRRRGMPYLRFMELMPGSVDVRIYFKTADGRRIRGSELDERQTLPGWDIHVVYVGGRSVVEVYKRSQSINEFELNQLLSVHAEGSFWKKVERNDQEPSAFGYEMIRDDGKVRARKMGGDGILFVDARLDTLLAEKNREDLLEKAPLSVEGF